MTVSEAMRLAAEHSCDMEWDAEHRQWRIGAISYDADACSLDASTLARIDADTFVDVFIPDREDVR